MKKCPYCGKEYPDEATVCAIDGEDLVGPPRVAGAAGIASTAAPAGIAAPPPLPADYQTAAREAAKKNMIVGGLWCGGGILVTVLTLAAASGGGTYVVAWGAIVFGGIQFFRGVAGMHAVTTAPRRDGNEKPEQ